MFNILRDSIFNLTKLPWNPKMIVSDFESGLIEAVRAQFPNTHHTGCHFHFTHVVDQFNWSHEALEANKTTVARFISL